ncbi:MAG: 30S ribosomal protein S17 [Patescibacteria group bacterium]|nr:30S ribosomal protein S17 [Patescibacteria group bacterium]
MRKQLTAKVISDKMDKSFVAVSENLRKHSRYKKYYRHRTKHYVHDEKNEAKVGDVVLIEETRPLSRLKRWRLVKIISKQE